MNASRLLRTAAVLIAVAGLVDPVWTRDRAQRRPLLVGVLDRPTLDLPDGATTRRARALASADRLRDLLADEFDVTLRTITARASACPAATACVIVADGAAARPLGAEATVVGGVAVGETLVPNVAVVGIDPPEETAIDAAGVLRVHLRGNGVTGTSRIEVADDGSLVGSAEHEWGSSPVSADAVVSVPWVPLAEGVRRLRVTASGPQSERTLLDNVADAGAIVGRGAAPIVIYEPEATWTGTFARRALEQDARFAIAGGTRIAPAISVARGDAPALTAGALAGAQAVVVAAPDVLTSAEVTLLERFARDRGGSVVLLFDRRPAGPVLRILPPVAGERQFAAPQSAGGLRVSEVVTFAPGAGATTLAAIDGRPVVVAIATGRGRVVVSGALDAWRFRDGDRFARFWTGVIGDAAAAAGPPLSIRVEPLLVKTGEAAALTIQYRSLDPTPAMTVDAAARLRCGSMTRPVRVWPSATAGVLTADVHAERAGRCVVEVTYAGPEMLTASTPLLVSDDVKPPLDSSAPLATTVAPFGGVVVAPGDEARLAAAARRLHSTRAPQETRPLRSPWWLFAFCGCLAGDWWLRRREIASAHLR
jgi:hypothetical protein